MVAVNSRVTALDKRISETLKALRLKAGLTQPQVATHLGVNYQSYQRMEAGGVSFRASTLSKFADLYHIDLNQLVHGDVGEAPDPIAAKIVLLLDQMQQAGKELLYHAALRIKQGLRP